MLNRKIKKIMVLFLLFTLGLSVSASFLSEVVRAQEAEVQAEETVVTPENEQAQHNHPLLDEEQENSSTTEENKPVETFHDTIEGEQPEEKLPDEDTSAAEAIPEEHDPILEDRVEGFLRIIEAQEADDITVPILTRIDGVENDGVIHAGNIKEQVTKLPNFVFFERAVIKDGPAETEIAYVTKIDNEIYFSFKENPDVGVLLKDTQRIVLIYESVYDIEYEFIGGTGSVGNSHDHVRYGENLLLQVIPDNGYRVLRVTSQAPVNEPVPVALDQYNSAQLTVFSNLKITIYLESVENFTLSEGYISNGYICPACTQEANVGGSSPDQLSLSDLSIPPDEPFTFVIWTNNNNNTWHLNNLSINGNDIQIPPSYSEGAYQDTIFPDGTEVRVTCVAIPNVFGPRDPHKSWLSDSKWRYDVRINRVTKDLVVSGNFKDAAIAEVIIKGKTGIERTGFANENRGTFGTSRPKYSLDLTGASSVHRSNTANGRWPSINLFAYKTLPGYNPWTVTIDGYGTGELKPLSSESPAATIFETTAEDIKQIDPAFRTWDTFISDCKEAGVTNAFYFGSASIKDQWLYLNAQPYNYQMRFNLAGGTVVDIPQGYSYSDNLLIRDERYSVDTQQTFYTLKEIPKRTGYIFTGWKLENSATLYSSNNRFTITEETMHLAQGDPKTDNNGLAFTFTAQWLANNLGKEPTEVFVDYYLMDTTKKDPIDGTYTYVKQSDKSVVTSGVVGHNARYFNVWHPGEGYLLNQEKSNGSVTELLSKDDPMYKEHNVISYYYDAATTCTIHYYKTDTQESLADSLIVEQLAVGSDIVVNAKEITGYTADEASKILHLEPENNHFVFFYTPHAYTIHFDANDGVGAMEDMTVVYDIEASLSPNAFTRDGYQFAGWSLEREGSPMYLDKELVVNLTTKQDEQITLFALWEYRINVTIPLYVCMYGYGGDGTVRTPDNYGITNYSLCDIQVESLHVSNQWTLVSSAAMAKGYQLKSGELYLTLLDESLKSGEMEHLSHPKWKINSDQTDGAGNFQNIDIHALIARGGINSSKDYHIVDVAYTVMKLD